MAGLFTSIGDKIATPVVKRLLDSIASGSEEEGIAKSERIVRLIMFAVPRFHRTALKNLEIAFPELSPDERLKLARRSYQTMAKNIYWFAKIPQLSKEEILELFDYGPAIAGWGKAQSSEVGTLTLTAHFGAFELFAQGQTAHTGPFNILNREFGYPRLDELWRTRREHLGSKMFSRKGGFAEIVRGLRSNQPMGLLFDQNVKLKHAAFVDFFGKPAATTKAIGLAAMRTNCPIAFGVSVENPPGSERRFHIEATQIPNPNTETGTSDEKIEKFLRRLHVELERLIRAHPEMWFWIHRRWKTRPDGEAEDLYE